MRELDEQNHELALTIWSDVDRTGRSLEPLVHQMMQHFIDSPEDGICTEVEGLTSHLPDFFSHAMDWGIHGWILYISGGDPNRLKDLTAIWERDKSRNRIADVDVYLSYFEKISRKK